MIIKKFLHSCILLEQSAKKLLFDPGAFCFIEGKTSVAEIGKVDAILITHSHQDHLFPTALKEFIQLNSNTKIFANKEIVDELKKESITAIEVKSGDEFEEFGFKIKVLKGDHEQLPLPLPQNTPFLINDRILHPGDSHSVEGVESCEILCLPISAPWTTISHSVNFAEKLKPRIVIPIHDAIIKEFMIGRYYFMAENYLTKHGIKFKALNLNEQLEI